MISVIIPVYNVEEYIGRAFNSLLNQTIGFENLEVILVDDKSTDHCREIIQDYANKYDNVKAIFLDENSGSGGKPRNVGMNHATKDYLMFLDSDDFFMDDACEALYDEITSDNLDIVSGVHTWDGVNPSPGLWLNILTNPHEKIKFRKNKADVLLKKFPLKIDSLSDCESIIGDFAFTPKIYRKAFLEKNSISFPEGIIAEDSVFLLNSLLNARGIKYINKIVYHYCHERTDGNDKSMSYIHSKKNLKSLLDAFYEMYYLSLDKKKSDIFIEYLLFQKLQYFLKSRLFKSNLSASDILDLLVYSTPLFKLCEKMDFNPRNINRFISDRDYENALRVIFGEDTLRQDEIKIISGLDSFNDSFIDLDIKNWCVQFEEETPHLFLFDTVNSEILDYCNKNNIITVFLNNEVQLDENNFDYVFSINKDSNDLSTQILDRIKFKYIPNIKHLVLFYHLDSLDSLVGIYNHFNSINCPYKHLKLVTSEENLFLSNTISKDDLKNIKLMDNYYFCFVDLSQNFIENNLDIANQNLKKGKIKNVIFRSSDYNGLIHEILEIPKISIIVPVFNVEKYLEQCLDSIINQSFKDIEIICVNDGSTDGSLEILRDYEIKHDGLKIINQENHGLGFARNVGLSHASGEYVLFVDSDDFLSDDALESMYNNSISNNSDLSIFKFHFYKNGEACGGGFELERIFGNVDYGNFTFNYQKLGKYLLNQNFAAWSKLYKREFLLKHNFTFPVDIAYEDVLFQVKVFLNAQSIAFVPEFLYNYRSSNTDSIMHDMSKIWDIIEVCDSVEDYLKDSGHFTELKREFLIFKIVQLAQYIIFSKSSEFFFEVKKILESFFGIEEYDFESMFIELPKNTQFVFNQLIESDNVNEFLKRVKLSNVYI